MKRAAQIVKIGLTVFLFSILPVVIFTLVTSKSGVLMGVRSFTVLSGSMEPTLPVGSIIYTIKQPTYEFQDVVSVLENDKTITHRIYQTVQKDNQIFFSLKGDANNAPDEKVIFQSQIVGKQVFMIPEIGKIAQFAKTPVGFGLLIGVPVLLVIGFEVVAIKKELEMQIEKRVKQQFGITT